MAVARVVCNQGKRKRTISGNLVSTVHDSIVWDIPNHEVTKVAHLMRDVYTHLPFYIEKYLGVKWNVRLIEESAIGPNMGDLKEIVIE